MQQTAWLPGLLEAVFYNVGSDQMSANVLKEPQDVWNGFSGAVHVSCLKLFGMSEEGLLINIISKCPEQVLNEDSCLNWMVCKRCVWAQCARQYSGKEITSNNAIQSKIIQV